jgi:hypothetical protein
VSLAARRSHRGDEFQTQVAAHWLILLLEPDSDVESVQVDPVALPDDPQPVRVDDVVIRYRNGAFRFIQAKKNQPEHRPWSIADLGSELRKALEQCEKYPGAIIEFCSGTPFGELRKLSEECAHFPTFQSFEVQGTASLKRPLKRLTDVAECSSEVAFRLARQLQFGPAFDVEQWEADNRGRLRRMVDDADSALGALEELIHRQQSSLRGAPPVFRKTDIVRALGARQVFLAPDVSAWEAATALARTSAIGRSWVRTVGNERIERPEVDELMSLVSDPAIKSVLLSDGPGTGKTCVLLDLADRVEYQGTSTLLFIRGDEFATCGTPEALAEKGLPTDVVGLAARVARERHLVVILDSLDVLSLQRDHGALTLLLTLVDRLLAIPNVVVVAACRAFDVQFEPQLLARSWSKRVTLRPLDFECTVRPLLERHGIRSESWSLELRSLATNPQNLRLLTDLGSARLGAGPIEIRSAHQLQARYLEEVVSKNPLLGPTAMSVLESLATRLISGRRLRLPSVAVAADPPVMRRLVSEGVLLETPEGAVQFSHQTLLDAVAVRGALARGHGLPQFVLSLPAFPFVRPAVRSFVAHLRALQPDVFERQVRATIDSAQVAYHLKRAIVETIAELPPTSADGTLVRFLWNNHPDLFRRCLARMEREAWLPVLLEHWACVLSNSEQDRALKAEFLLLVERWTTAHPQEVIRLWREALANGSAPRQLGWRIAHAFKDFRSWSAPGVLDLITAVSKSDQEGFGFAGALISRYVEATGEGDDLLWEYVTRLIHDESGRLDLEKLRCEEHHFHHKEFLGERLRISDRLLGNALDAMHAWSTAGEDHDLLHSTSWKSVHYKGHSDRPSSLSLLVRAAEDAVLARAGAGGAWWREREPSLRALKSSAVRYILLRVYHAYPEQHRDGAAALLVDRDLLRAHNLEFEVGRLINAAFPYLPVEVQQAHEDAVLSLYSDVEPGHSEWAERAKCDLLLNIPASLRSRAAQKLLDRSAPGRMSHTLPRRHGSAGWVSPPVSDEVLLGLSKRNLWKVLRFYEQSPEGEHWYEHTGGLEHLCSELAKATSRAPMRVLALFEDMWREQMDSMILAAVVRGAGAHLRYRHGVLQRPNELKPDEPPLPDVNALTHQLAALLESCSVVWRHPASVAEALEGCAECTADDRMGERLVWLLLRLFHSDYSSARTEHHQSSDVMSDALNTTWGIAASAGAALTANLLEKRTQLPALLKWFLVRCSSDSRPGVRAALLSRMGFVLHKDPEFGWRLLSSICEGDVPSMWEWAEKAFYYQLRDSFERARPFLDRMAREAPDEAGETWGRLSMLAALHGKLTLDEVFATLEAVNAPPMWKGAIQVLFANASDAETSRACHAGLLRILHRPGLDEDVLIAVDHGLFVSERAYDVEMDVVGALVDALPPTTPISKLHGLFRWTPNAARRAPKRALPLIEKIAAKLTTEEAAGIYDNGALALSVLDLLREADLSDDPALISRVIALQDRLLFVGFPGIEEMLDEATGRA